MNERELRGLIDQVKTGGLSRRGFVRKMMAVGLTAPMATQLLAISGVAMAQASTPPYKPYSCCTMATSKLLRTAAASASPPGEPLTR